MTPMDSTDEDRAALGALRSAVMKCFGPRMSSTWSAWANEVLTEEEIAAIAAAGVAVQRNCTNVSVIVTP